LIGKQKLAENGDHKFLAFFALALLLSLMVTGCALRWPEWRGNPPEWWKAWFDEKQSDTPSQPLPPQVVDEKALEPGLAVLYREKWFKDVDEMTDRESDLEDWRPGKPILYIDSQFGSGEVFGSGLTRKVGVRMTGFLHLEKPGLWEFKAYSNDGIRVILNGQTVVNDPLLHYGGDRFSSPRAATVNKAGWYPLLVKYFQKKGTAALTLYWKAPGAEDFSVIPAEAYAHLPE
jgi:hypothetical protein